MNGTFSVFVQMMAAGAVVQHQTIADPARPRMQRAVAEHRADEVQPRLRQAQHWLAGVVTDQVLIVVAPIVVAQAAVAQILDAGRAGVDRRRQRASDVEHAEQAGRQMAEALQRRAVMRAAEADQMGDLFRPQQALFERLMRCTAGDQPAHAVTDQRHAAHFHRPVCEQGFECGGEVLAVLGDVPAAVVAEEHRRVAVLALQLRGVGIAIVLVGIARPDVLVAAQAVQEHCDVTAGVRVLGGECRGSQRQQTALAITEAERGRQAIAAFGEEIAEHAIGGADNGLQAVHQRARPGSS